LHFIQILLENEDFDKADKLFDEIAALDPKNGNIYVHKAMSVQHRTQDLEKTLELLHKGLAVDNKNQFILETLGTMNLQL